MVAILGITKLINEAVELRAIKEGDGCVYVVIQYSEMGTVRMISRATRPLNTIEASSAIFVKWSVEFLNEGGRKILCQV